MFVSLMAHPSIDTPLEGNNSKKMKGSDIMLSPVQERIVNILNERVVDAKTIADKLGRGYDEFKVQSMILTLARKGHVDMTKAALILRGTNMIKFLKYEIGSSLVGSVPTPVRR